jgi:hypothetical protein
MTCCRNAFDYSCKFRHDVDHFEGEIEWLSINYLFERIYMISLNVKRDVKEKSRCEKSIKHNLISFINK